MQPWGVHPSSRFRPPAVLVRQRPVLLSTQSARQIEPVRVRGSSSLSKLPSSIGKSLSWAERAGSGPFHESWGVGNINISENSASCEAGERRAGEQDGSLDLVTGITKPLLPLAIAINTLCLVQYENRNVAVTSKCSATLR